MSSRSAVTPVVLVLLAAGAAAYATLVDRQTVSDADREARPGSVLPGLRVEEVTRVRLEHGDESVVLERDAEAGATGTRWRMTSPHREPADAVAVDVLLRELEDARRLRSVGGDAGLGLEPPRAKGVLDAGARAYRFSLGGDALRPEGAAYLRVEGEGTFVVDGALKAALLRGADAYRDRAVVPYGAGAIAGVEVRNASGVTTALERHGATFRLVRGGARASRAAVDRLLSALGDARVDTFLDEAWADAAVERPALTVIITPRDGAHSPVELRIGGPCPDAPTDVVVVRVTPRVSACVSGTLTEALTSPPPDALAFFAHADEMEEVRLEPVGVGGPTVDIARKGPGWHERAPADRELSPDESDSASALVQALAEAEGSIPSPAPDRFEPRSRVTIVRTGTSTSEAVDVAAPAADGTALARRADDGVVLRLSRAAVRRFQPHPVALRGGSVWHVPFDAGSVVGIDDGCAPTRPRVELVGHRWALRAPAGAEASPRAVTELTLAAAKARAIAWIAEADDGGFGFDAPGSCSVSLALGPATGDGPPRRVSISFGAPGEGGVYARTQDDPAVFVAPEELVRAFAPPLDRSPPQ